MKMLVIVPTRGRPENAARLEKARLYTAADSQTDFLYVVDDDDPKAMDYLRLGLMRVEVVHRERLGPTLNSVAVRYMDSYDALGFMGDDHLPRSYGWDTAVLNALDSPDPRIVYGDDLLQGANLPTAVFMQAGIVRALRSMVPSGMVHLYLDNYWKVLGERLGGLVYLPDVTIEHIHPAAGKAEMDDGYREANAPAVDSADRTRWLQFERDELDGAVERVRAEYAR